MRKEVLLTVMVLWAGVAFAETTSGPTYSSPNDEATVLTDILNEQDYVTHDHQYTDTDTVDGTGSDTTRWPLVVGVDARVLNMGERAYLTVGGGYDVRNNSPVADVKVHIDFTPKK